MFLQSNKALRSCSLSRYNRMNPRHRWALFEKDSNRMHGQVLNCNRSPSWILWIQQGKRILKWLEFLAIAATHCRKAEHSLWLDGAQRKSPPAGLPKASNDL